MSYSHRYNFQNAWQEKNGAIEQLEKEKQKKGEQVQQANADLARQAALIKDLQGHARGKKEAKPPGVSPEQVCAPLPSLPYPILTPTSTRAHLHHDLDTSPVLSTLLSSSAHQQC